jgi:hypothetical protein
MSLCGDGDARWAECSATIDTAPQAPVRRWDGVVRAVENRPRPS